MIKLYLFERNVFTAIFFTESFEPALSHQKSHIKKAQKWDFSWKFIHKWVGKLDIQREKIWDPRDHRVISNLAH